MLSWNKTLIDFKIIRRINSDVFVSYQVTTEGGGGIVSSRDFIFASISGMMDKDCFVQGGASLNYDYPRNSKIVRAWNGPGAQCVIPIPNEPDCCYFVWLLDCDYNGWIPNSILDMAMPQAQSQFIDCVRQLAKIL